MQAKIAFYSDLHTEFKFKSQSELAINNDKDLYIFAGDLVNVANAESFLADLRAKTDKPIIVVLGNHDFYGAIYHTVIERYKAFCKKYNIIFLENEIYVNEQYKLIIFGATFWSDFKIDGQINELAMLDVSGFPDFRYIYNENFRLFKPEDICYLSEQTQKHLLNLFEPKKLEQQGYQNYTKIVVSHFTPLTTLGDPKYLNSLRNIYFNPDYEHLLKFADIWIYGHDHYNLRKIYFSENNHRTLILSNQHGYINEKENLRECPENNKAIEIDYSKVSQSDLDQLGNDFYPDICLKI